MKKILLVMLDGFGIGNNKDINYLKLANMKNYNKLISDYPNCSLDIGIKDINMINSDITSLIIGSGKIIKKDDNIKYTLGSYLSDLDLTQVRIADASSYANVTYFFDGAKDIKLNGCQKFLVNNNDNKYNMSCIEITKQTIKYIDKDCDFILINFNDAYKLVESNNKDKIIKALEFIDVCLGKLCEIAQDNFYTMFITGSFGCLEDSSTKLNTKNKVPFIICDDSIKLNDGYIYNIAPTILDYMDITIPDGMEDSLIIK